MRNKAKTIIALLLLVLSAACFTACKKNVPGEKTGAVCTLSVDCLTILDNIGQLDPDKLELIPEDGYILHPVEVAFEEGESVFDIVQRELKNRGIHMEASFAPAYNSAYIEGINNIYEFDCGYSSGWEYCVNGEFPNYGCSAYYPKDGDVIEFRFTCDLGNDLGNVYGGE